MSPDQQPNAEEALRRLEEGNGRFVRDERTFSTQVDQAARQRLISGQRPFAIILSCSDSRVPAELVFDQGIGDLFVIRVAGNIIAPSLIGSVEFAAAAFDTRLAVVMGHSRCGALTATLEQAQGGRAVLSDNMRDIVERCRPAVDTVLDAAGRDAPRETLLPLAIRANVRVSCAHLRHGSRVLERLQQEEGFRIVGAEYAIETGKVDFFDLG